MFMLSVSWGRVDGAPGLVAEWESLTTHMEGVLPCPRSRQVSLGRYWRDDKAGDVESR